MTITYLTNTSSGAPALTGAAGSLIGVLDFCLVTTLGWSKAFSGTNTASYRAPTGNRLYLGVDNSGTLNARVRGFETMTAAGVAVASGTGPFPTDTQVSGGQYIYVSSDTSTVRNWRFISDGTFFYFSSAYQGVNYGNLFSFGDIVSYATADAYATVIGGEASASSASQGPYYVTNPGSVSSYGYSYTARNYTQVGVAVRSGKLFSLNIGAVHGILGQSSSGVTYPSLADGALYAQRVYSAETNYLRGHFPGLWAPGHYLPFTDGDTFTGSGDLAGRTFIVWSPTSNAFQVLLETSDTWRA